MFGAVLGATRVDSGILRCFILDVGRAATGRVPALARGRDSGRRACRGRALGGADRSDVTVAVLAEFPERPVLLDRVQLQPSEQRRSGRFPGSAQAVRTTTRTSGIGPSTPSRRLPHSSAARPPAIPRATRLRTGCRPCSSGQNDVVPFAAIVYYVNRSREHIAAPPKGLMMVAGNSAARTRQPKGVVAWTCGAVGGTPRYATIPACREDQMLQLQATFPNCWDGRRLDSADHKQHLRYAKQGRCPSSHPVAMPQIILIVLYPPVPLGSTGRVGTLRRARRLHERLGPGGARAPRRRARLPPQVANVRGRARGRPRPPDSRARGRAGRAPRALPRPRRRRARPLPAPRSARPRTANARRDAARTPAASSGRSPLVRRQGDRLPRSRDVPRDVRARVVLARRASRPRPGSRPSERCSEGSRRAR